MMIIFVLSHIPVLTYFTPEQMSIQQPRLTASYVILSVTKLLIVSSLDGCFAWTKTVSADLSDFKLYCSPYCFNELRPIWQQAIDWFC